MRNPVESWVRVLWRFAWVDDNEFSALIAERLLRIEITFRGSLRKMEVTEFQGYTCLIGGMEKRMSGTTYNLWVSSAGKISSADS
jgi:hypothetical protein